MVKKYKIAGSPDIGRRDCNYNKKIKDIAEQYGFDPMWFDVFASREGEKLGIKVTGFFSDSVADEDIPRLVEAYKAYEAAMAKERVQKAKEELLLTTCPSVEGCRVTAQLGLVFGECAFQTGILKSSSSPASNPGDMASMNGKTLSGTSRIFALAREYAINQMLEEALARGANAVIGVDSRSSVGGDITHVEIFGTAVKLEPIGH